MNDNALSWLMAFAIMFLLFSAFCLGVKGEQNNVSAKLKEGCSAENNYQIIYKDRRYECISFEEVTGIKGI